MLLLFGLCVTASTQTGKRHQENAGNKAGYGEQRDEISAAFFKSLGQHGLSNHGQHGARRHRLDE